ncbi:ankyrin repeat domain-containing protein [Holosporaceae bacterium 'Namur']|nr:ankyrin repeat domain-containing protein [Holosporaceae bacterium 'Namur']
MRNPEIKLIELAFLGKAKKIKSLIKEHKNLNIKAQGFINGQPYNALIAAAQTGHTRVVEILLNKQQKPGIVNRMLSWLAGTSQDEYIIALGKAARNDHLEVVKLLLKRGLDLNKQTKDGETLLITAAKNGHTKIVKELLSNGADFNLEDKNKNTALIHAAEHGHRETLEILLEKKLAKGFFTRIFKPLLRWFIKLNDGETEYSKAFQKAIENGHIETAELLLSKGLNINIQGELGYKTLISAAKTGSVELVSIALNNGIDPDKKDKLGYTALMHAAENGHIEVVAKLLNKKANVNAYRNDNSTALMLAVKNQHKEIVKLLLDNGADLNTRDIFSFKTPLIIAAENGNLEIAASLIKAGADINITDIHSRTANELTENIGIKKLLEKYNAYKKEQKENMPSLLNITTQYISNRLVKNQDFKQSYEIYKKKSKLTPEAIELINDCIPNRSSIAVIPYNPTKSMVNKWVTQIEGEKKLFQYSFAGKTKEIKYLLRSIENININAQSYWPNNSSYTPLMVAAAENSNRCIAALLMLSMEGHLPLAILKNTNIMKTVVTLLKAGADPDITSNEGQTAKDLTQSENVKQLLEKVSEYRKIKQEKALAQRVPFSINKKKISSWAKQIEQENAVLQEI